MEATHAELVEIAAKWLTRQGCNVVLSERNAGGECPDAIGWYCSGFTSTVVECKVSLADFRADAVKVWRNQPSMGVTRWYLAPKGLLMAQAMPPGWGLLEWTGKVVRVKQQAGGVPSQRDEREEARLLLSELRIYHAQGITYRKGDERWKPRAGTVQELSHHSVTPSASAAPKPSPNLE